MPTSSCSRDSASHRKTGTPISPVPINRMRTRLKLNALDWRATRASRRPGLRHHLVAGGDFTLADRRSAAGAKVIVDFLVRENQQEPFAHRHGGLAFLAIEARGGEILKLLLTHAPRSLHRSRSRGCAVKPSRAAQSRRCR